MAEQRRLVARIDALAAKIDEAKRLREEASENANRMLICMAHWQDWSDEKKTHAGWTLTEIGRTVALRPDPVKVDNTINYPNLGIYSFGRGLFEKPPIEGIATSATTLFRVRAGHFIYSRPGPGDPGSGLPRGVVRITMPEAKQPQGDTVESLVAHTFSGEGGIRT